MHNILALAFQHAKLKDSILFHSYSVHPSQDLNAKLIVYVKKKIFFSVSVIWKIL